MKNVMHYLKLVAQLNRESPKAVVKTALVYDVLSEPEGETFNRITNFENIISKASSISNGSFDTVFSKLYSSASLKDDIVGHEQFLAKLQSFNRNLKLGLILPFVEWCQDDNNYGIYFPSSISILGVSVQTNWMKLVADVERYLSQFLVLLEIYI